MLTVLDGDHTAELADEFEVYTFDWSDEDDTFDWSDEGDDTSSWLDEDNPFDVSVSDNSVDMGRFATGLLDPGLSPHAFRGEGEANPINEAISMWRGTDEALRPHGLRRGAPVTVRDLVTVLDGCHTQTGRRVLPAGSAFELVLTAPHSVSFIWSQVTLDEQRQFEAAMMESSAVMLNHLTRTCPVIEGVQPARSFVAALVLHAVGTRSPEVGVVPPMLHVHCCLSGVLANDGTMCAPDETTLADPEIARMGNALGHAELATRIRKLGYGTELKADQRIHTFEITGFPKQILDETDFWRNVGCAARR